MSVCLSSSRGHCQGGEQGGSGEEDGVLPAEHGQPAGGPCASEPRGPPQGCRGCSERVSKEQPLEHLGVGGRRWAGLQRQREGPWGHLQTADEEGAGFDTSRPEGHRAVCGRRASDGNSVGVSAGPRSGCRPREVPSTLTPRTLSSGNLGTWPRGVNNVRGLELSLPSTKRQNDSRLPGDREQVAVSWPQAPSEWPVLPGPGRVWGPRTVPCPTAGSEKVPGAFVPETTGLHRQAGQACPPLSSLWKPLLLG